MAIGHPFCPLTHHCIPCHQDKCHPVYSEAPPVQFYRRSSWWHGFHYQNYATISWEIHHPATGENSTSISNKSSLLCWHHDHVQLRISRGLDVNHLHQLPWAAPSILPPLWQTRHRPTLLGRRHLANNLHDGGYKPRMSRICRFCRTAGPWYSTLPTQQVAMRTI